MSTSGCFIPAAIFARSGVGDRARRALLDDQHPAQMERRLGQRATRHRGARRADDPSPVGVTAVHGVFTSGELAMARATRPGLRFALRARRPAGA